MKRLTAYFTILLLAVCINLKAQTDNSEENRVKFDPKANPANDLKTAVVQAKKMNKRIILDIGGEWCIWCHRLDNFIDQNEEINKFLHENFIAVKVNYSEENKNEGFLSKYPEVKGYPHIFVLDKKGKFLHSQDTGELEKEKSYDADKIMTFLKKWAPKK